MLADWTFHVTYPAIYNFVVPLVVVGAVLLVMWLREANKERRENLHLGAILCFVGAGAFLQLEYFPSLPSFTVPFGAAIVYSLIIAPGVVRQYQRDIRVKDEHPRGKARKE